LCQYFPLISSRFVIHFPLPDLKSREKLWRANIPAQAPLADDVNFSVLAEKYAFSGGNIKNCCFKAADMAALRSDANRKITMAGMQSASNNCKEFELSFLHKNFSMTTFRYC